LLAPSSAPDAAFSQAANTSSQQQTPRIDKRIGSPQAALRGRGVTTGRPSPSTQSSRRLPKSRRGVLSRQRRGHNGSSPGTSQTRRGIDAHAQAARAETVNPPRHWVGQSPTRSLLRPCLLLYINGARCRHPCKAHPLGRADRRCRSSSARRTRRYRHPPASRPAL